MSRGIVLSNGNISDYSYYKNKLRDDDFVICADGAIRHSLKLDIVPRLWIGDFDSCSFDDVMKANPTLLECETIQLDPVKDVTDTHFCCDTLINRGIDSILIWGALGGRCDHMLSNIHLLEYLLGRGIQAKIEDEKNTISITDSNITITKERKYLSIIPLDNELVIKSGTGLLYPVDMLTLPRGISMGVSNEIVGYEASITIEKGMALIIESDD